MIELGSDMTYQEAASCEWLVTNGLGGYASGTVATSLTRGYHGLLIAALDPPVARTLMLTKLDETLAVGGREIPLYANAWADGTIEAANLAHLQGFWLEGTTPVWQFGGEGFLIEKRIWMPPEQNTTCIRYDVLEGEGLTLSLRALVDYRDHHSRTEHEHEVAVEPVEHGVRVMANAHPLTLLAPGTEVTTHHTWMHGFQLAVEAARGEGPTDNNLHAATFEATLAAGESLTVIASAEDDPPVEVDITARTDYEAHLLEIAPIEEPPPNVEQLILAADQFIVRRGEGKTVIAGYHWFGDWGRDTMIALPGLTLCTGRRHIAADILRTFAQYVERGMLPNRFPEIGEEPEYNTVDATLWFFEAIRAVGDDDLIRELFPVLRSIIRWHQEGTRYAIRVDPDDGLLRAGVDGVQLTWMDAKVGDWVVTPRIGKPVEINALWYNALRLMEQFAMIAERPPDEYKALADRVEESFGRFWNGEYLLDVIDGPQGDDAAIRPNQLFAVSLPSSPLTADQMKAVVDVCAEHLLTPRGLRSLAASHPDYVGTYIGDRKHRDGAYHQGTVWSWLIGPFATAHHRVYDDPAAVIDVIAPLMENLAEHGLGSISEVFDGDPPYTPRGCIAQAWSVAELLRAWVAVR